MRYEPRRRELLIVFQGGRGTYRYFNVPAEEWRGLLDAESKGAYLNEVFKRKEHPYIRLMEPIWGGVMSTSSEDAAGRQKQSGKGEGHQQDADPLEWGEAWSLPRLGVQSVEAEESAQKIRA
jgi:hypothetical protein